MIYFSYGCTAQYKNRKHFANLCCHEIDIGMPAEWHFFATSHGNGPCDGVGGTVKCLAARASLQRPYDNQIMTAHHLFLIAQSEIPSVNFYFATTEEYQQEAALLYNRYESARTVAELRLHCIHPISSELVEVREFSNSNSEELRVEHVLQSSAQNLSINFADIKGYITAKYDGHWWLGCVMQTFPELNEVEVNFLHPHGPAQSFRFPQTTDILTVSCLDILNKTGLQPTISITGRTYTLTTQEMTATTMTLARTETYYISNF